MTHASPQQDPADARYRASAAAPRSGPSRAGGSWLKWALLGAAAWTIVMIVVGIVGMAQIINDRKATERQRNERSEQLGRGVGMLTAVGWAPAIFVATRRWFGKSRR